MGLLTSTAHGTPPVSLPPLLAIPFCRPPAPPPVRSCGRARVQNMDGTAEQGAKALYHCTVPNAVLRRFRTEHSTVSEVGRQEGRAGDVHPPSPPRQSPSPCISRHGAGFCWEKRTLSMTLAEVLLPTASRSLCFWPTSAASACQSPGRLLSLSGLVSCPSSSSSWPTSHLSSDHTYRRMR